MNVAVCFNRVPPRLRKGEAADRVSEEGAEVEAAAVCEALKSLGHTPIPIPLGEGIETFVADLRCTQPDVVFNLCEGFWGDSHKEMHIAALFELLGFPYTGAPPLCLGVTQDKARAKDLLGRHSLPTPRYLLVEPSESLPSLGNLPWPLIAKPRFEDASLGISAESVVDDMEALHHRVCYLHDTYRQGALVEEFIDGREINVAILGNGSMTPLPLSEIRFQQNLRRPIVSYEGKWIEESHEYAGTRPVCPAPLTARQEALLREVSLKACTILGCRDYARVDIRLRDDIPYILEVNANPDISPDAGFARAARVSGMSYRDLIGRILSMAVHRKERAHAKP